MDNTVENIQFKLLSQILPKSRIHLLHLLELANFLNLQGQSYFKNSSSRKCVRAQHVFNFDLKTTDLWLRELYKFR